MDYYSFFDKLKKEDNRIEYENADKNIGCEGIKVPDFYNIVNPVNVEFEFNDGIVRLEPFEGLAKLNELYKYTKADCVFATCNGEPIYEKGGRIYTCMNGTNRKMIEEEIAGSINSFFEMVYNTL